MRCYGNYLRDSLGDGRRPSEWNLFVALVDLLLYSRRSVGISGYAYGWRLVGGEKQRYCLLFGANISMELCTGCMCVRMLFNVRIQLES